MRKELFSLIKWSTDISDAPKMTNIMVIYKDITGDSPNYYTMFAWCTYDGLHWISENDTIDGTCIVAWAPLPEYRNIVKQ